MLEKLVPPLNLCRKIPKDAFRTSEFVWLFDTMSAIKKRPEAEEDSQFFYVEERDVAESIKEAEEWGENPPLYPAPTLEEITHVMPLCYHGGFLTFYGRLGYRKGWKWTLALDDEPFHTNRAETALHLWLHIEEELTSEGRCADGEK